MLFPFFSFINNVVFMNFLSLFLWDKSSRNGITESKAHLFLSVIDAIELPIKRFYQPKLPTKVNECAYFPTTLWILCAIILFHVDNLLVFFKFAILQLRVRSNFFFSLLSISISSINYSFMFFADFYIGLFVLLKIFCMIKW